MTSKPTLNDIGLVHGTDKSTRYHGYLPVYAQALEHLREETFTLIRDTVESVVLLKHAVIVRKRPDAGRTWRRTDLKDIQEAEDSWMVGEPESYRRIEGEVVGASDYVGKALAALVDEGRVDLAAPVSARVHDVVVSTGGLCLTA